MTQARQLSLDIGLADSMTLDNFLVADNAAPVAHVRQALQDTDFQCIYLWGPSGSGKTHLLQGVFHGARGQGREARFVDLQSLRQSDLDYLYQPSVEVVCLDNMAAIAGQAGWEEALFHLFNRLHERHGLLLVSARQAPGQLPIQLPDLVSRLGWGTTYRLAPLKDRDHLVLLCQRAAARGLQLSDEVAQYVLYRSARDPGQLMAVLDQLDQASLDEQRKLTIPFVRQILKW